MLERKGVGSNPYLERMEGVGSRKSQRETLTKLNIIYRIFKQDAMPEHEATHMALKDIVNNTRLQPPKPGVSGMVAHAYPKIFISEI